MTQGPRNSLREPAMRTVHRPATVRKPAVAKASGPGPGTVLLCLALLVWAVGSTGLAVWGRVETSRRAEEQAELRQTYDDKIRALTRRLVGVASHQALEQDGLTDRMADLISRQVELENRQASLVAMTERLNAAGLPGAAAAATPTPSPAPDQAAARTRSIAAPAAAAEPPTLRLGAPPPADPATRPRSDLPEGTVPNVPGGRAVRVLQAAAAGTLREQFAALEGSMGRIESGQARLVGAFSSGIASRVASMRTALAGLSIVGPEVAPEARPAATRTLFLSAPKPPADPFEEKVAALERDILVLQHWKVVVDTAPLHRPVEGDNNLTSNFGGRKDPFTGEGRMHAGIDFRGPIGTPIRAAGAGRVITADVTGGYGNLVEVDHGNGLVTRYAHLSALSVTVGQTVQVGQVVGLLGSTGRSTGPHLHYETRINGGPVDPMRFILAGAQIFNLPPPVDLTPESATDDATFD